MNTFGLKRKGVSTFWLLSTVNILTDTWNDVIRFSVKVLRRSKVGTVLKPKIKF